MRVEHGVMTGIFDRDGELSDEAARHIIETFKTRDAILKYVEPMAQVLAAAGLASEKALGDSASYAIDKWAKVISDRAKEIVREDKQSDARLKRVEATK